MKLGGDIAAAAGPVGRDSQASTTELANAEFLTYSRSQGLFAGVDLTGDEVHQNTADTEAYYGKDIPYKTILSGAVPAPASAHHFVATVNEMFRRGRLTGHRDKQATCSIEVSITRGSVICSPSFCSTLEPFRYSHRIVILSGAPLH